MSDDKEVDLRGAIKNLKSVAKTLDAANFHFAMPELAEFVAGIKFDKTLKPPEDVLKIVLNKFLRGEKNFSSREVRALPFIIFEPQITSRNATEILNALDFSRTSHLRGVVSAYLNNYDKKNAKTEILRRELYGLRGIDSPSLEKIFAAREYLFGDERFKNMSKLFADKLSVNSSLEEIGLSDFYKISNFIQAATANFFYINQNLDAQFKFLSELAAEYDTYKNIFPYIASALIQRVARNFQAAVCGNFL